MALTAAGSLWSRFISLSGRTFNSLAACVATGHASGLHEPETHFDTAEGVNPNRLANVCSFMAWVIDHIFFPVKKKIS